MEGIEHRMVNVNGLNMHIAEKGQGPTVLLLHGFPELWYSWRHQILALASQGYRAVAPDLRGFGDTDDYQIDFYKNEGLTPYSRAKLPIISDVPEGCVIIREHIPQMFNEVDRFTSRDQLSFSTVRDKVMSKVDWSIYMFLDCERRNFVIQTYHRDLLEHMPPPPPPRRVIYLDLPLKKRNSCQRTREMLRTVETVKHLSRGWRFGGVMLESIACSEPIKVEVLENLM